MTTFTDGVCNGVENFFSTSGRMSRSAFWWFALCCALVVGGIILILFLTTELTAGTIRFMNFIIDVTFWYVMIVPGIRRMHDIDYAGSTVLWVFLPFIGWIYVVYLFCKPSDPEENVYGMPTII